MTDQPAANPPRYGVDPYLDWVAKEGLVVAEDYGIDLFKVETKMWPRVGLKAAACHLKGRGDFANMFLFELPPGGNTQPQKHLYEEVVYVLEGVGYSVFDGERIDWSKGDLVLLEAMGGGFTWGSALIRW